MNLSQEILNGNITALGQGITLIESTLKEDEIKAQNLFQNVYLRVEILLELE